MGGTFDPIHYGHLVTAEAARCKFGLDCVIFVPSGHPPHKKDYPVSPTEHRYLMTVLAVVTNTYFDVSRIEIDREGYSYTIDTVKQFREMLPDAELYFITGADAVLEILSWKNMSEILDYCHLIAASRPGYQLGGLKNRLKSAVGENINRIHSMEVPALAISSTSIRKRVSEGQPIKYLLPESVEQYILKNNLYQKPDK
jgi:nicotinate-nucleotide adenylyltransferase